MGRITPGSPETLACPRFRGGEGIGGGIGTEDPGIVTFDVLVDDPAAYLKKAQSLGGKVVQEPQAVPGGPTIARFSDPAGNVIGLVKAQQPVPRSGRRETAATPQQASTAARGTRARILGP